MKIILIYVIFSVSGLLLLKIGATKSLEFKITEGDIYLTVNTTLLIGTCLYLLSFLTSLIAMKSIDLSIFYPVSAGLGYILVCLLSYLILKESITKEQLMGMICILVGVVLMNLKK